MELTDQSRPARLSWFTQSTFRYTPLIAEIMVVSVVLRLLGLVQPFVFQTIIDRVLPFQREATLVLIVVVLVVTALFSAGLEALAAYLGNHMANRLISELARRIFRHVLNLPLRYLQKWQVGETLARISEIDTVRGFLTGTVSGIALDVVFAITYIAALLSISPFLTSIVLIVLPLRPRSLWLDRLSGAACRIISGRLPPSIAACRSVRECHHCEGAGLRGCPGRAISGNAQLEPPYRVSRREAPYVNGAVGDILGNGSVILIIFFGSKLVLQNEITLGELIAFHLLADKGSRANHVAFGLFGSSGRA